MSTECPCCADPDKFGLLPAERVNRRNGVTILHPDKFPCGGHIGVECKNQDGAKSFSKNGEEPWTDHHRR
jgi:hypothetical protein